jgi:transcriptional regulator with XRE-family HTH domain
MKLEHVMARSIAELRKESRLTQQDLACRMRTVGLNWTPNRVTQIETLRRTVSLLEAVALAWVFGVPVTRLMAGPDAEQIDTPAGETVALSVIRNAFSGQRPPESSFAATTVGQRPDAVIFDELRRPAKTLGVTPAVLNEMAEARYGRSFLAEREGRLGDAKGTPASIRSRLGHITRRLLAELADGGA